MSAESARAGRAHPDTSPPGKSRRERVRPRQTRGAETPGGRAFNLALATLASTICFWAWTSIAPLGVHYSHAMDLSASQAAVLVAMPVLVGSLGRIPAGILTDRFGGRIMFTIVLLATVPALLLVALAGSLNTYPLLLTCALLLGVAGTVFAVGIPFVSNWYDTSRRGFATGVFGAGMGGTALSAFLTPRFIQWFDYLPTHLIIAALLSATGALVWFHLRDAPPSPPAPNPSSPSCAPQRNCP